MPPLHKLYSLKTYIKSRSNKGQTILEFAMIIMIFLMAVGFAIEVTNISRVHSMLHLATYAAARSFAVNQDADIAEEAAKAFLGNLAQDGSVKVSPSLTPAFGQPFQMTVEMKYESIIPWANFYQSDGYHHHDDDSDDGTLKLQASIMMVSD